ncbi:hypothetical protein L6R52_15925 [Myxococcota bacterium]|nr:hypothetical protein [Myxococcota bacterium]
MSTNEALASEIGRKNRRWHNLLLDRRFQLKYTAMIVGVATLVSTVLGVFLLRTVRESSRMLKLEAEFDAVLQAQLAESDARVAWALVGAFLAFNVVLAILAVMITHRMAGPIFVMGRYVRELGQGRLPRVRKLRKGDEFVELVDAMSEAVVELEARTRTELASIDKALEALAGEHGAAAESARRELAVIAEQKRRMLAARHGSS